MTRDEIVKCITPVLEKYPVARASFFGSYARENYTPASDVDILVDFYEPKVGLMFFSLREDMAAQLPIYLDLVHKPGLKYMEPSFRQNVEREELMFYEKNPAASV